MFIIFVVNNGRLGISIVERIDISLDIFGISINSTPLLMKGILTLSALQTKTDTFKNSVDSDETPLNQDLHCLSYNFASVNICISGHVQIQG